MKIISHRGNIRGPKPEKENHPSYIQDAFKKGYEVEIDVWYINDNWYLGHDEPQYVIPYDFLFKTGLWLHAKNGDAFYELKTNTYGNVFWHTNEDWVLTNKNYIWTFPGKKLYPNSICVLPEHGYNGDIDQCYAICTDYPQKFAKQYN